MTKLSTPLKKQELVETFMRKTILAAAKKVLAANTYDRTSLDQIAQEAQVSKGSIYVHFHSKEDLLWEVLKESLRCFIESGKAAAAQAQTPLEKLRAIVHAHLGLFAADPDMFKIALSEKTNLILNPRGRQIQTQWETYQEYAEWVGELFRQASEAREIRPVDTRRYALLLFDMVLMVMYQRLAAPTDTSLTEEADEIMDLFLAGLIPRGRLARKEAK
jgi:TetR/AcrR family transcriptional regulator